MLFISNFAMHLRDALRVKAAAQHSSSELGSAFALALHLHQKSDLKGGSRPPDVVGRMNLIP